MTIANFPHLTATLFTGQGSQFNFEHFANTQVGGKKPVPW